MATHYNPKIVDNGLVLYLDAANPRSYPGTGTAWTDLSGNGNNCNLFNSPIFSSKSKGCFTFSTNQYGTLVSANNFNFSIGFTISIWFSPFSALTGFNDIRQSLYSGNTGSSFAIELGNFTNGCAANGQGTDGRRFLIHRQGSCFSNISSPFQFSTNDQLNFTYTRNAGGVGTFYVNGNIISSINDETSFTFTSPISIDIARRATNSSQYFNGDIYLINKYNRALSEAEVLQNFNATRGRFGL